MTCGHLKYWNYTRCLTSACSAQILWYQQSWPMRPADSAWRAISFLSISPLLLLVELATVRLQFVNYSPLQPKCLNCLRTTFSYMNSSLLIFKILGYIFFFNKEIMWFGYSSKDSKSNYLWSELILQHKGFSHFTQKRQEKG